MKNNFILILVLIFLLTVSLASAEFIDNCRCKEFCEENNYCFFGVCDNEALEGLNCLNDGEPAEPCPACPACDINPACLYDGNKFLGTDDCMDYFDTLTTDPRCRRTFHFSIFDADTGSSLLGASISLASLVDGIDYTAPFAYHYSEMASKTEDDFIVPRCQEVELVTIVASKRGYDADVILENMTNDQDDSETLSYNFNLPKGICHADCTDSFNRCNPECEGFTNTTDTCNFYVNPAYPDVNVTHLCAYKTKGTQVTLEVLGGEYKTIECCEGEGGIQTVSRPKSDIGLVTGENLISTERLVKFTDNNPGKIYIYVWD